MKTPRATYFRQIARRPTAAPVVLHPPHQVLRRWEIAQRPMPVAAPAVPLKPKERKSARTVDSQPGTRAADADQSATAEQPLIAPPIQSAKVISDAPPRFPTPPAADPGEFRVVVEEHARMSRMEARHQPEKPRVLEYTPSAARSAPASISPQSAAQRPESSSVEIGAIEVQIVPPPAPAQPARPAPRRAPAPQTSLSRDFTTTFGLRQG